MQEVEKKVSDFFGTFPTRKYRKGQVLILNEEEPKNIFYLTEGKVKEYDVNYRGEEIILNIYKPGSFFPMSFALNGGASPYIFEADDDIELRACPAEEAVEFVKSNPDVALDLLTRVYRGTDVLLGRIFQLASGSAKSRLAYELAVGAKRFGHKIGTSYEMEITEKDLAARAGLSRETVSREISKLKEQGIIHLRDGKITISDLARLEDTLQ